MNFFQRQFCGRERSRPAEALFRQDAPTETAANDAMQVPFTAPEPSTVAEHDRFTFDDILETESVLSEEESPESSYVNTTSAAAAAQDISTRIHRAPHDVRRLRAALIEGDQQNRQPLPAGIADKILSTAKHWCLVEKKCDITFSGENMDFMFFKFGPISGQPKRLDLSVTTHDQGWSNYPEFQGKREGWTWGELDVKDRDGNLKLDCRPRLFTNIQAESRWQRRAMSFGENEGILQHLEEGDTLEFYFRSRFPGWCIYVKRARMTLYYEPPLRHPQTGFI